MRIGEAHPVIQAAVHSMGHQHGRSLAGQPVLHVAIPRLVELGWNAGEPAPSLAHVVPKHNEGDGEAGGRIRPRMPSVATMILRKVCFLAARASCLDGAGMRRFGGDAAASSKAARLVIVNSLLPGCGSDDRPGRPRLDGIAGRRCARRRPTRASTASPPNPPAAHPGRRDRRLLGAPPTRANQPRR
jgi:hypothetical protein